MKSCASCGLPAPSSTLACALCSRPFPHQGPTSYRLESHPGGYRWLLDGEAVVTATWREGSWDVVDADSGKVAVTLIGAPPEGGARVAMVDHRRRAVATFLPAEDPTISRVGLVRDSYDHVMMAVRSDGPTGIHVVDTTGNVLALASRHGRGRAAGLELLVTRAGAGGQETVLFGVALALELLRSGELHTPRPRTLARE